jgi:hypothetical protein
MEHGCNDSPGTFGMFSIDDHYEIQQPLAQFFVAQLINLEWAAPGDKQDDLFPATGDLDDGAGHAVVTSYALKHADGQWSLLIVNRDQQNPHCVRIEFHNEGSHEKASFDGRVAISIFGKDQYQWHPGHTRYVGHAEYTAEPSVVAETTGRADPDGPILHSEKIAVNDTSYDLPAASVVVIRGSLRVR